jgi:hypothetical protein
MPTVPRDGLRHRPGGVERRESNMRAKRRLTAEELAGTLIRVMKACLRRLRMTEAIGAVERETVVVLSRMDVTGYRAAEKRSLMVELHRECNRI